MGDKSLSPKQFLKQRRPERFSDSVVQDTPILDRSFLEYHLETLTSRSQELLFEAFARAIAMRTVCPNLLPHTGPSGGGDSKVDSETYPVADQLALGWHVGHGDKASTERWAFAFTAKKKWRPKLEDDLAKIVKTGRGYTKAFLVSNQFIRDKKRAEVEDALRKQYGIDVRIFDRTWILDTVFERHLEELAIDTLQIHTTVRREVLKGPRDIARARDLEAQERSIQERLSGVKPTPGLVKECLDTAELARSLELPRPDIDGRFIRARQLADQAGTLHQRVDAVYEWAWTTFWWFEDCPRFLELFREVETLAIQSDMVYDLELLTNLFFCLYIAVSRKDLDRVKSDFDAHAHTLTSALDRVISYQERPTAALQARTFKLKVELLIGNEHNRPRILRQLKDVVKQVEPLVGYPFQPLSQVVVEWGDLLGHLPEYQELFEELVLATSRRKGEISAAQMLLARGAQLLDSRAPGEAIRAFGRAMGKLFKHESRRDAVKALYLCSHAYERLELLWAARGTALAGAAIATADFFSYQEVTPAQAICYERMKWLELSLGRVPHLLAWHEINLIVHGALIDRGFSFARSQSNEEAFDPIVGMLLLRSTLPELRDMTTLPNVLEQLGLPVASIALKYALGHEDQVPQELVDGGSPDDMKSFFLKWRDQPAAGSLPEVPLLYTAESVSLESDVAGCHLSVQAQNESPCIELAESLLASTEALLATALIDGVIAREPELSIRINVSEALDRLFTFRAHDVAGRPHIEISCRRFDPHSLSRDDQQTVKDLLFEVVAHICGCILMMSDPESLLTRLFRDDLASQRAMDFTTSFVSVNNVLGHKPKTTLASWTSGDASTFTLKRENLWDADVRPLTVPRKRMPKPAAAGAEIPPELTDFSDLPHRKIRTISLVRESLWNQAGWRGVGFAMAVDASIPPVMAFLFDHANAGFQIFEAWRSELGARDEAEQLRIVIIRNISRSNPHWYRIVIGSDLAALMKQPDVTHLATVSRIHTMMPSSSANLDRFLGAFRTHASFLLSPGWVDADGLGIRDDLQIEKRKLIVRNAWEIGPHDTESVAVFNDDDPIVPDGVKDPPFALIRARRATGL